MVQIYKHNNINFNSNGDMPLTPYSLTGKIELNGICEIELQHPYDNEGRYKEILEDSVIACPTPWSDKQLFRIYSVVKNMTGIIAYARHIFFDLADCILLDVRPTNKTGQQALNDILANTEFTGHSNIVIANTAYYVRKNIVEALASDDENSFVSRWGGERFYDNFDITINETIGADNNVRVEFGYNLKEIEEDTNLDDAVTRIIPVGDNGIMLEGPSPWVDSLNINKYANIKTKVITFDDVKVKAEGETEGFETLAEAQAELINRCNLLFENGIDTPKVNYKVSMEDLSKTTAYKDYQVLETVNLGDTVHCKHGALEIDITARCISLEWEVDFNTDTVRYKNIELGNFKENYFDKQSDISNRVAKILNKDGSIKADEIAGFINSAKTRLRAQREIGQLQDVRAFIWEDLDPSSPTYGCMVGGSAGIQISQQRTPDGKDWDFTSAFTAEGIIADKIVGSLFASKNGATKIWMETGTFESEMVGGGKVVISPLDGFYFEPPGGGKRGYHNLSHTIKTKVPISQGDLEIILPDEFQGKEYTVASSVNFLYTNGGSGTYDTYGDEWVLKATGIATMIDGIKIYPSSGYEYINLNTGQRQRVEAYVTLTVIA